MSQTKDCMELEDDNDSAYSYIDVYNGIVSPLERYTWWIHSYLQLFTVKNRIEKSDTNTTDISFKYLPHNLSNHNNDLLESILTHLLLDERYPFEFALFVRSMKAQLLEYGPTHKTLFVLYQDVWKRMISSIYQIAQVNWIQTFEQTCIQCSGSMQILTIFVRIGIGIMKYLIPSPEMLSSFITSTRHPSHMIQISEWIRSELNRNQNSQTQLQSWFLYCCQVFCVYDKHLKNQDKMHFWIRVWIDDPVHTVRFLSILCYLQDNKVNIQCKEAGELFNYIFKVVCNLSMDNKFLTALEKRNIQCKLENVICKGWYPMSSSSQLVDHTFPTEVSTSTNFLILSTFFFYTKLNRNITANHIRFAKQDDIQQWIDVMMNKEYCKTFIEQLKVGISMNCLPSVFLEWLSANITEFIKFISNNEEESGKLVKCPDIIIESWLECLTLFQEIYANHHISYTPDMNKNMFQIVFPITFLLSRVEELNLESSLFQKLKHRFIPSFRSLLCYIYPYYQRKKYSITDQISVLQTILVLWHQTSDIFYASDPNEFSLDMKSLFINSQRYFSLNMNPFINQVLEDIQDIRNIISDIEDGITKARMSSNPNRTSPSETSSEKIRTGDIPKYINMLNSLYEWTLCAITFLEKTVINEGYLFLKDDGIISRLRSIIQQTFQEVYTGRDSFVHPSITVPRTREWTIKNFELEKRKITWLKIHSITSILQHIYTEWSSGKIGEDSWYTVCDGWNNLQEWEDTYKILDYCFKTFENNYTEILGLSTYSRQVQSKFLYETQDDIPEEFLCSLSSNIMLEPVRLPNDMYVEKSVILRSLQSTPVNPFTRLPLSVNDIRVDDALKSRITKWKRFIREKNRH